MLKTARSGQRAVAAGCRLLRRGSGDGGNSFTRGFLLSRLVGIVPCGRWRDPAVISGVDRDAPAITSSSLAQVFSIGVLFGYLRYRSNST